MNITGYFSGHCVSRAVGPRVWRIVNGGFTFSTAFDGTTHRVPDGFLTDFASVPRIFWPIIPSSDYFWDAPSVMHDHLVRSRKVLGLSLMDCHRLFLHMLLVRGRSSNRATQRANTARAYAMYWAVVGCNWMFAGPGDGTTPTDLMGRVVVVDLVPA